MVLSLLVQSIGSAAQDSTVTPSKIKVAIFAPLYLDSAFDASENYRYGKAFPKFINPGLEFYEGAALALDSLEKEGLQVEVFVYDTRDSRKTLNEQLNSPELENLGLIIAYTTPAEIRTFAEAALEKKVPFINANLPNDGGITANPFFVILNSTLRTQIEGIYKFVQKYYSTKPIIVFRKRGAMEDLIKNYINEYGRITASVPLNIKYVDLDYTFTANDLSKYLNKDVQSVAIVGSLEEGFGKTVASYLAALNGIYPVTVIGMPTWDNSRDFLRPEYKGLEIIYSTPFYNAKTDKISTAINTHFATKMWARPSDMVFRGYEVTYRYVKLLNQYKQDLASNFGNRDNRIFTDFDIQPVFINRQNMTLDYFENKKLYFIKLQDGVIKTVL